MKRLALLLALLIMLLACFQMLSYPAVSAKTNGENRYILPASLRTIEDAAFEGTAVQSVILSDHVASIGERAFAYSTLRTILIPSSVSHMEDSAFDGVWGLVIRGAKDSYAARWAKEQDIAFVQSGTASALLEKLRELLSGNTLILLFLTCVCPDMFFRQRRRTTMWTRSMRPQDRVELYPIDYKFP